MARIGGQFFSARQLQRLYLEKQITPVIVIEELIRQIDDLNAQVVALTAVPTKRALSEAHNSAHRYASGTARPLEGIPFVAKDNMRSRDVVTEYGSNIFLGHIPTNDADCISILRENGAILLGKASTHEFAWGVTTDTDKVRGPSRNPWDLNRTAGGSSAGSAIALACGFAPIALGSDTAGSLRIPAAFCGVSAFKPSRSRISVKGVFPLAPSLDHVGLMARDSRDLLMVLEVLMRRWEKLPPGPSYSIKGLRLATFSDSEINSIGPDKQGAKLSKAIDLLASLGATCQPAIDCPELNRTYETLADIILAEAYWVHTTADLYPRCKESYSPDVRSRLEIAREQSTGSYISARIAQQEIVEETSELFARVDLLIGPVVALAPPELTKNHINCASEFRRKMMLHTALQSLCGLPTLVFPLGLDENGLPFGIQITGPQGADENLLAVGLSIQALLALPSLTPPLLEALRARSA